MRSYFLCKFVPAIVVFMGLLSTADACTGIKLKAKDGAIVRGRTLEFAQDLDSDVIVIPRNFEFTGNTPSKSPGLKWKTKFAIAGANFNGEPYVADGINEKGLSGGVFYFPDFAVYQTFDNSKAAVTMAPWQLITWILGSFSTLEEVKQALPEVRVCNVVFAKWMATMPLHYIVMDAKGECIVIEYVKGKLNIHDNPSGTLTNSPDFPWHLINLRNYMQMSPKGIKDKVVNSLKLIPAGQGSGMLGMPGDYTPPSRFVRAFFFSSASIQQKNAEDAAIQSFHILNNFDIPLGTVRSTENNITSLDRTQWTNVCDLKNKLFYYKTENDSRIRVLKLMKCDLSAKKIIKFKMATMEKPKDITAKLK